MVGMRRQGRWATLPCVAVSFCLFYADAEGQASVSEQVLVTAQKRERPLLETPVALTTLGQSDVESGFGQTADLQWLAPSLQFTPGSQPQSTTFSIRGVATFAASDTLDRSVGVVWDDIGQSGSVGENVDLVDVERVEVARGPQGTLFGESATAGLIHVVTAKPAFENSADLTASLGSENERRLTAIVNVARDNVALRVAAWRFRRDGFVDAPNLPSDLGDKDDAGWRTRLRWQGASSEANLIIEGVDRDAAGPAVTHRAYQGFSYSSALQARDIANGVIAGPENFATSANGRSADKLSRNSVTFRLDHEIAGATLTSISGWRLAHGGGAFDPDYTDGKAPAPDIYLYDFTTRAEQISQEFRVASASGAPLDYVAGAVVQRATIDATQNQAGLRLAPVPIARDVEQHIDKTTIAAFADLSAPLGERWRALGGVRYAKEEASASFIRTIPPSGFVIPGGPFSNFSIAPEFDHGDWSWRAGVEYAPEKDGLVYFTLNRAAKSPAFNFTADTSAVQQLAAPLIVAPETVLSQELGYKRRFAGGAGQFSMAIFHAAYDDFQGATSLPTTPLSFVIVNVDELRTQGVEIEGSIRVAPSLSLSGGASYVDAEFTRFPNAPCYAGQTAAQGCAVTATGAYYDVSGTSAPNAPRWSANIAARYESTGGQLRKFAEARLSYKDDVHFGLGANPADIQPAFSLLNLSAGVEHPGSGTSVRFYARNVFDKAFAARITPNNGAILQFFPMEARFSVGATIEKRF